MIDDQHNPVPDLDQDPDVLAEKKKNLLAGLRLERYKQIASASVFFLQTFRSEAISFTSGMGTVVMGYFQIKKYIAQSRREIHPRSLKPEAEGLSHSFEYSGGGEGGAVSDSGEGATMALAIAQDTGFAPMSDPGNYALVVFLGVFVWASVSAWLKKRRKKMEVKDGNQA